MQNSLPTRQIGGYLTLKPDVSFVVEDENETVVGSAVAVLDAREFRRKLNVSWMDVVRKMYPIRPGDESPYVKVSCNARSATIVCFIQNRVSSENLTVVILINNETSVISKCSSVI